MENETEEPCCDDCGHFLNERDIGLYQLVPGCEDQIPRVCEDCAESCCCENCN